jgi:hypothetical protein
MTEWNNGSISRIDRSIALSRRLIGLVAVALRPLRCRLYGGVCRVAEQICCVVSRLRTFVRMQGGEVQSRARL